MPSWRPDSPRSQPPLRTRPAPVRHQRGVRRRATPGPLQGRLRRALQPDGSANSLNGMSLQYRAVATGASPTVFALHNQPIPRTATPGPDVPRANARSPLQGSGAANAQPRGDPLRPQAAAAARCSCRTARRRDYARHEHGGVGRVVDSSVRVGHIVRDRPRRHGATNGASTAQRHPPTPTATRGLLARRAVADDCGTRLSRRHSPQRCRRATRRDRRAAIAPLRPNRRRRHSAVRLGGHRPSAGTHSRPPVQITGTPTTAESPLGHGRRDTTTRATDRRPSCSRSTPRPR